MSKKKKLSPTELAKAKAAAALRAPLLILLTRKLGFARLTEKSPFYRAEADQRVYLAQINDKPPHLLTVSRGIPGGEGTGLFFKDRDSLLLSMSLAALMPLAASEAAALSPSFDNSRPIDRQETQPVEAAASKPAAPAWPAAPAAAPIHWGDKPK